MACTSAGSQHCGDTWFSSYLQATRLDVEHLAAFTGLTSLAFGNKDKALEAFGPISQLTLLRSLQLESSASFTNAQLRGLSTLCRLTSLQIKGG